MCSEIFRFLLGRFAWLALCCLLPCGVHAEEMVVCEKNWYRNASLGCSSCPAYSTSPVNSNSNMDCVCDAGFGKGDYGLCYLIQMEICEPVVSVTCSGTCECIPIVSALHGTISDGPTNYPNSADCQWIFTAGKVVNLQFTMMETEEDRDYLTVEMCTDAGCAVKVQLHRTSGFIDGRSSVYSNNPASYPFLRVGFTSDTIGTRGGFKANWWSSSPTVDFCDCPASTYLHNFACQNCPPKSISAVGSTASTDCVCDANWYRSSSIACSSCPPNSTSPVASTSDMDCVCDKCTSTTGDGQCMRPDVIMSCDSTTL